MNLWVRWFKKGTWGHWNMKSRSNILYGHGTGTELPYLFNFLFTIKFLYYFLFLSFIYVFMSIYPYNLIVTTCICHTYILRNSVLHPLGDMDAACILFSFTKVLLVINVYDHFQLYYEHQTYRGTAYLSGAPGFTPNFTGSCFLIFTFLCGVCFIFTYSIPCLI